VKSIDLNLCVPPAHQVPQPGSQPNVVPDHARGRAKHGESREHYEVFENHGSSPALLDYRTLCALGARIGASSALAIPKCAAIRLRPSSGQVMRWFVPRIIQKAPRSASTASSVAIAIDARKISVTAPAAIIVSIAVPLLCRAALQFVPHAPENRKISAKSFLTENRGLIGSTRTRRCGTSNTLWGTSRAEAAANQPRAALQV
jgi:hypothetical protein